MSGDRRAFLKASLWTTAAAVLVTTPAWAQSPQPVFLNGQLNVDGELEWDNGGGDPLRDHLAAMYFAKALALPRLNLDKKTQIRIRSVMARDKGRRIDLDRDYRGEQIKGVMLSGNGWLAINPIVNTHKWHRKKFGATHWAVSVKHDDGSWHRWSVIVPDVCNNLILIPLDTALPCRCDPGLDACAKV